MSALAVVSSGRRSAFFHCASRTSLDRTAELLPTIPSRDNTVIGNDVWIGRDAVIMPA
jgi:acetyltransferase-like isoleucine patch superfamily enzyme